jgi:hypothetical protein
MAYSTRNRYDSKTVRILQYFCSRCNAVLKETRSPINCISTTEECPSCGSLLIESLRERLQVNGRDKQPFPNFQTAHEISSRLSFGIEKMDSFFRLGSGDRICIIGKYAGILVSRLCVRALIPARHGGLGSSCVLFIDGGNSSDHYRAVNFARQYGLNANKVLQSVVVSRAFTVHQLAGLLTYELPKAIKRFNPKVVVISELLSLFVQDQNIDGRKAKRLLSEIAGAVDRVAGDVIVAVSARELAYREVLPRFDVRVETHAVMGRPYLRLHHNRQTRDLSLSESELLAVKQR